MHSIDSAMSVINKDRKTSTIYYQGMHSSQAQLAKYTGEYGFIATTGEHVVTRQSIHTVLNPFLGQEIEEVDLNPFNSTASYFNPVKWAFGLRSYLSNNNSGIVVTPGEDQSDKSVRYHSINLDRLSIGQDTDIQSHHKKVSLWQQTAKTGDELILYGVSRGAATTFNALAKHHYPMVKLVVLEGCFYSINDVFEHRFSLPVKKAAHWLLSQFAYKDEGASPAKSIECFPQNIPVVFVSSKIDKEVPYASCKKLAQALADRGKNKVYLLTLNSSSHPNYMCDDEQDKHRYQAFIHAVYKEYELPHDENLAKLGAELLSESILTPKSDRKNLHSFFQEESRSSDDVPPLCATTKQEYG
jgi:predicted esterase